MKLLSLCQLPLVSKSVIFSLWSFCLKSCFEFPFDIVLRLFHQMVHRQLHVYLSHLMDFSICITCFCWHWSIRDISDSLQYLCVVNIKCCFNWHSRLDNPSFKIFCDHYWGWAIQLDTSWFLFPCICIKICIVSFHSEMVKELLPLISQRIGFKGLD